MNSNNEQKPNNNTPKHLCVNCDTELAIELDFLNFTATPNSYCPNSECVRYGLVTVVGKKVGSDE